jgi:DNA-binding response OmpR family regulator
VIDRTQSILEHKQKERRKREIQRQIDELQAELQTLEGPGKSGIVASPQQVLAADDRFLKRGKLTLDLHTRRVLLSDQAINLPPTSFDYLLVLARHTPNVVDYQTLVSEAQGYETDPREAQELTKWHIHHIRQAIEQDSRNPIHVINVRGAGYRLVMN